MSTKAPVKTQAKTPAAPVAARIPQPPVAVPEHEAMRPAIATQLESAARLGHSLGAVGVDSPAPPTIQRQEIPEEEEEELQMKREPVAVQRQELPEEEEEELMLRPEEGWVGPQGGQVPPDVEVAIRRARGGGQPLEGALQEQMRASLGHDFSRVRVHTDAEADELNQQLQAKAFTTGPDIFFRRGEYTPSSPGSRELIAHELSHVVQQSSGRVNGDGSGMTVRPAGDAFEQEADSVSDAVTRSINTSVQRQTPEEEEHQSQTAEEAIQTNLSASRSESGSEDLETRINSARGSGQSLSSDVREAREKEFGADFRDVRVHSGSDADAHKKQVSANVFTIGSDRFFMCGECAPDLLALQRAVASPDMASRPDILALQRTLGNRAMSELMGGPSWPEANGRDHRNASSQPGGLTRQMSHEAKAGGPPSLKWKTGGVRAVGPKRTIQRALSLETESHAVAEPGDLLLGFAHGQAGRFLIPFLEMGAREKGVAYSHAAIRGSGGVIWEMKKTGLVRTTDEADAVFQSSINNPGYIVLSPPSSIPVDWVEIALKVLEVVSPTYSTAATTARVILGPLAHGEKKMAPLKPQKTYNCVSLAAQAYIDAAAYADKHIDPIGKNPTLDMLKTWAVEVGFTRKPGLFRWNKPEEKKQSE